MTEKEIQALIERYIVGECSPDEKVFLERWYADELEKRMPDELKESDSDSLRDEIWGRIVDQRPQIRKRRIGWRVWGASVAYPPDELQFS